jgi:hypothetical protein
MDRSFAVRPVARDSAAAARAARRHRSRQRFAAIVACLTLVLAACDLVKQPPTTQPSGSLGSTGHLASKVVGPAGGAIAGPAGTQIVIPPGALLADTTIAIEETSAGAPPLPTEFSRFGPMFAFTPHGTTFAAPVTVTLPFDAASLPPGETPTLYKTNAQNQWEQVTGLTINTGTVSGQVTSFSLFAPGVAKSGVERIQPIRTWTLSPNNGDDPTAGKDDEGEMRVPLHFGRPDVFDIEQDEFKSLEVFSSTDGVTFWAISDGAGQAHMHQVQTFIKKAENATLQFEITAALMEAIDHNGNKKPGECPATSPNCPLLLAYLKFEAEARNSLGDLLRRKNGEPALDTGAWATMEGSTAAWKTPAFGRVRARTTATWTDANFDETKDVDGDPGQFHPRVRLINSIVLDVDLSEVELFDSFEVSTDLIADADNLRGGESGIGAFLRDPAQSGGTVMKTTGLELTSSLNLPPIVPTSVPCTTGPDPAAGALQFSAASYSLLEGRLAAFSSDGIFITRSQGSKGAVSATLTAGGGTATPGVHYTPLSTTVLFADGDTAPLLVDLDILFNDTVEPNRTVNLTLSEPGGCATLGAQSSSALTILDDDAPFAPPAAFTVGGTVNGLIGRLVLENHRGLLLEVTEDGPFTFTDIPTPSGEEYFVKVFNQPFAPVQHCTVTNGSGTFTDHDVTNVQVDCV